MENLERVLLIDDDETNNFLNQRLFSRLDPSMRVKVLENGHQAFNYLYNICQENYDRSNPNYFKPQLILLDVNMPEADGFEFLEMYQKLNSNCRNGIVLVLLTTAAQAEDEEKARKKNIDLLVKPLTAEIVTSLQQKYFPVEAEAEMQKEKNENKTASNNGLEFS